MYDLWSNLALLISCIIIVSKAVEAATEIISSSELFNILIRVPLSKLALPKDPNKMRWYWTFFFKLVSCGYCMSVWVALFFSFFVQGFICTNLVVDIIIKTLLLHRLSNWWHIVFVLRQRGRIVPQDIQLKLMIESSPLVVSLIQATSSLLPTRNDDGTA